MKEKVAGRALFISLPKKQSTKKKQKKEKVNK